MSAAPKASPVPVDALGTLMASNDAVCGACLIVDLRGATDSPDVSKWLRTRPYPVLALIDQNNRNNLVDACDLVETTYEALAGIIANVELAPVAAATLVQTLRLTETMAVPDALTVESLAYASLQASSEFGRWIGGRKIPPPSPAENGPAVLLQRVEECLYVTLNRPLNRNAISVEMRDALVEAFELAAADLTIARMVINGAGPCFSVGGDLTEFGLTPSPGLAHMIRMERLPARALLPSVERARFDLHGACIGAGIELPAFAPHVTARAGSFFQLPEIRFGLIPGAGGCVSIPRRIGRHRMAHFALSARRISTETALEWGLVDEIIH